MKSVTAVMKSLLPALAIACWVTHAFAQSAEAVYNKPNEERAALLVDSIQGNAFFTPPFRLGGVTAPFQTFYHPRRDFYSIASYRTLNIET